MHEVHAGLNASIKLDDMSRSRVVRLWSILIIKQDPIAEISTGIAMFSPSFRPFAMSTSLRPTFSVRACRGLRVLSQSVALDVGGDVLFLLL